MKTFTFKRYRITQGETIPFIRWTFLPVDLDETATATAAGFDPKRPFRFGLLLGAWHGHPDFALVVTGMSTPAPGEFMAVSAEKGTP